MVKTLRAFLEFCYIARRNVQDTKSLAALTDALERFHRYRVIFEECGVRLDGFALPRQHSLAHYAALIRAFGAPNGLCSSITESKHIKAVKEPWRRSSRYEALGQMLLTNQRLDKLAASRVDFTKRGMLQGTCLQSILSGLRESLDLPCDVHHNTDHFSPIEPPDLPDDGEATAPVQSMADDEDEDEDDGAVAGPKVMAHVDLAKTVCGCPCIVCPVTTIKTRI
jgi:hypothetical protein